MMTSPDTAAPAAEPDKWRSAPHELFAVEFDAAVRAVGCKPDEVDQHAMSFAAASAVVLARRHDRSIKLDTWKTLRPADLDIVAQPDMEDPTDPTPPA